jgi:hypothetical protein
MTGKTIKQMHLDNFFQVLEDYKAAKAALMDRGEVAEFVKLSVQIHIAKSHVTKRLWPLVNQA